MESYVFIDAVTKNIQQERYKKPVRKLLSSWEQNGILNQTLDCKPEKVAEIFEVALSRSHKEGHFADLWRELDWRDMFKPWLSSKEVHFALEPIQGMFSEPELHVSISEKTTESKKTEDLIDREILAEKVASWVQQIRQYYFSPKNPLHTKELLNSLKEGDVLPSSYDGKKPPFENWEKAMAWIRKYFTVPKGQSYSSFLLILKRQADLPKKTDIRSRLDFVNDIKELAKATGWSEYDTLMHVLTGEIPELFKFRIVRKSYSYAGPIGEPVSKESSSPKPYKIGTILPEAKRAWLVMKQKQKGDKTLQRESKLLSRNWVAIEIDRRNLKSKELEEAYQEARKMLGLTGKRSMNRDKKELYRFLNRYYERIRRDCSTDKECWEKLYKLCSEENIETRVKNPDNLRRVYIRYKAKIDTGYL